MMNGILMLEDGVFFEGKAFGSFQETCGEVVFNTSMTGYQEILTDPSYCGQIITMTYPLIGNYGTNHEDIESKKIHASGFIIRENSATFSSWRSKESLESYLKKNNITGISDIDTRALTRHIRNKGAMRGVISTGDFNIESLHNKVLKSPKMSGRDLTQDVTCQKPFEWKEEIFDLAAESVRSSRKIHKVVVMDFGVKFMILRKLYHLGCSVYVVPSFTDAQDIIDMKSDGVVLSNGPGDPEAVGYAIETVQKIAGKLPIFGICLGHQILSLAFGGKTYKLKFGHRGANHPVKNLKTGKIEITAQNHGFTADCNSFKNRSIEITHINLNDGTCEGIRHKNFPIFSVQYHPEASPGPHDSDYLFHQFIDYMKKTS